MRRLGLPPIRLKVPLGLARGAGGVMAGVFQALSLIGEPPLTPFLASELAQSHFYDISRAKDDFGYRPLHSMAEATDRTIRWLKANL